MLQFRRLTALVMFLGVVGQVDANNWNTKEGEIKTWNGLIPERYSPNLETVRHHFLLYNSRRPVGQFDSIPSSDPRTLEFSLRKEPYIDRQLKKTYLASYIMYEQGKVVIDEISPDDRFGDFLNNQTLLYSMSLGKSLGSYLMAHAICRGHIESIDHKLSDWPLVSDTLIASASVRDVVNATMGHQGYMKNNETFKASNFNVNNRSIRSIGSLDLAGSRPATKRYEYGQLPANVALSYINFKTGNRFEEFMNEILRDYVGLESRLRFASTRGSFNVEDGIIRANFFATRYDTLRIGISILEDWNNDTCVGKYLKDIYRNRVSKGAKQQVGDGYSRSYGGSFHIDYPGVNDTVMGMDGYGGIALLINFDDQRIVYAHAAHRNYNYKKIILDAVEDGEF